MNGYQFELLESRFLLANLAINLDTVDVEGGAGNTQDGKPHRGGNGGSIIIEAGLTAAQVNTGAGTTALSASTTLSSGTYEYSEVLAAPNSTQLNLMIDGHVIIRTQGVFAPTAVYGIFHPGMSAPSLEVYSGNGAISNSLVVILTAPAGMTNPDGSGMDGGHFEFYTTRRGTIAKPGYVGLADANGANGTGGGSGGNAGSVYLLNNAGDLSMLGIDVAGGRGTDYYGGDQPSGDGGNGGSAQLIANGGIVTRSGVSAWGGQAGNHFGGGPVAGPRAGNGGNGGTVAVRGDAIGLELRENGGNGGENDYLPSPGDGKNNQGGQGGNGGNGGSFTSNVPVDGTSFEVDGGNGGAGGNGGLGNDAPTNTQGFTGPGMPGGNGGNGGNGGAPANLQAVSNITPKGGLGGNGGAGLKGGAGTTGGKGGDGGDGGKSGGPGARPGTSGFFGAGGFSASGPAGAPGAMGNAGLVGSPAPTPLLQVNNLQPPVPIRGLTIITHGFQPNGAAGSWITDMAGQIIDRAGAGRLYNLDFDTNAFTDEHHAAIAPTLAPDGQTVIVFDWASKSNNLGYDGNSEPGWREAAGDILANSLLGSGIVQVANLAHVPIHFIAHSYGAVVISEAIRRLGRYGVQIDQMTTFDPHDQDQDLIADAKDYGVDNPLSEPKVTMWSNVAFADNYWEDVIGDRFNSTDNPTFLINPVGHKIAGAQNIDLSGAADYQGSIELDYAPHARTHEWYYQTILDQPEPSGFGSGSKNWFPAGSPATYGFAFSNLGGFKRMEVHESTPINGHEAPTIFDGDFHFGFPGDIGRETPGYLDNDVPLTVNSGDPSHGLVGVLSDSTGLTHFSHRPIFIPAGAESFLTFGFNAMHVIQGTMLQISMPGAGAIFSEDISPLSIGWRYRSVRIPVAMQNAAAPFTVTLVDPDGVKVNNLAVYLDDLKLETDGLTRQVADANRDGTVTSADAAVFFKNIGMINARFEDGDFNSDGVVGFVDFQLLELNFGRTLQSATTQVQSNEALTRAKPGQGVLQTSIPRKPALAPKPIVATRSIFRR